MSPTRFLATFFAVAVALLAAVSPAAAQREAGPYGGVLGGSDDPAARHTLTLRASFFGAWDDISRETEDPAFDNRFLRSGFAGGASGGLTHARRSRRNQWLSSADTALRIYGSGDGAAAATFTGRTGLTSTLNSRVSFSSSSGFTYSPYYDVAPDLDQRFMNAGASGAGFGVATAAQRNMLANVDAGLSVRLSRRDTLEFGGNARRYDFLDQPENSITWYGGRVAVRHTLTQSLGIHAGFGRDVAEYESATTPRLTNDTIDFGVDYGDTLKFSRRTALSFSSSTSAVRWLDETHYRLNGSAALTRAFGRTGSGSLRYARITDFTPGFQEPLLTDSVSGGYSDQIGRRTSWFASVGYTRGTVGFVSDSSRHFDSYNAGGRWTTALTRHLGVFSDYTYYRYEVPPGAIVFEVLPKFSRHSVSVGLSVWAPLINDTRAPTPTP